MATKLTGNGGYSWWQRPIFIQSPSSSNIYFSAITNDNKARAFFNDFNSYTDLASTSSDDHNCPAIMVRPNKARHSIGTRHGTLTYLNHYKATTGINFVAQPNITQTNSVCYTQLLDYGDKLGVFSRVNSTDWRFRISTDWGSTWGGSRRLLNFDNDPGQKYMITAPSSTPGVYHLAAYGHPVGSTWRGMVYGTINFNTEDVSNSSGVIANLDGTGLPLTETSLDDIAPCGSTEVARLFDVGEAHGRPVIMYAKWDDTNDIEATYYYAYRDDEGEWQHMATGIACGEPFYAPSRYYGGMSIDKNGNNRLALAREEAGTWYVDSYPINSNMTLGTKTNIASNSEKPLVRPHFVEGGSSLIYQELRLYSHYTEYGIWYWKHDF